MTWWSDLWSGIRERFSRPGIDPSGAAILTTSYGINGNESILPTLVSSATQAYLGNAVVFGAELARISLFGETTFVFRNLEDKSLSGSFQTDGRKNTALRKLENPWPNGTTGDLLARMMLDADLAGNAYIWDAGFQLVRLRPDWVTIVSEWTSDELGRPFRRVIGYFYDPPPLADAGPPVYYTVDEIAHWAPNPDPTANFRGMSWMTPVLREVSGDNAMTEYKIKYLENAASPNLLIKYAQKIGQSTIQRIADRIQDRHGGVENAFRTLVLDEGADATVIGNTFEQMNFSTVQAAGENRIIIASGVPGIVIGSKEGLMAATYSNYEQAMRRFADITMRPLWRSVCDCLATLVAVPPGERLWFDVKDIAALRQGEKEQADTTLVLAQAIAALVKEGYEPKSVAQAVTSGDMTQLKFVDKPPEPKLEANVLNANPDLAPAVPGAPAPKALNGTPVAIGAGK
jgi:phage portal protein BeeE